MFEVCEIWSEEVATASEKLYTSIRWKEL